MENHNQEQPRRSYARPADRSFGAYKAFLEYLTTSLGGENDVTEPELREAWREFWQKVDAAAPREESR